MLRLYDMIYSDMYVKVTYFIIYFATFPTFNSFDNFMYFFVDF